MEKRTKAKRTPILLSMMVYPGAGQILQGRWLAGILFAFGFTVFFVVFGVCVYRILAIYYKLGFGDIPDSQTHFVLWPAVVAFIIALGFYVGGIVDTVLAFTREQRKKNRQRVNDALS
jgi:NhaP-type Na+/H+ or K+/H+ antiporter